MFDPDEVPLSGISLFKPDWMHTKSLGTDAYLLGSCLLFLVSKVLPGTELQNIGLLWESIQTLYGEHNTPCRMSRRALGMIKSDPFPRLSAKAMEIRHLLPAVEHFLKAWVGLPLIAWFHSLVAMSCKLDELVFSNKTMVLNAQERRALKEGIFKYNQVLTRLARHFHDQGLPFCNYTIKNHYLCHIVLLAAKTGISPRLACCYEGEDFMSIIKTLCVGSQRGVESAKLIDKVMPKYLQGLDFLLQHC